MIPMSVGMPMLRSLLLGHDGVELGHEIA
jgi:hypothetical protein